MADDSMLSTAMAVTGGIIGATGNAAFGAFQQVEFGKAGMAWGAALGLAGWGAGEYINNNMTDENGDTTYAGAALGGLALGAIQSTFSTAKELEAIKRPNSMAALSSINTTTTATAMTNILTSNFEEEGKKRIKALEGVTEEQFRQTKGMQEAMKRGEDIDYNNPSKYRSDGDLNFMERQTVKNSARGMNAMMELTEPRNGLTDMTKFLMVADQRIMNPQEITDKLQGALGIGNQSPEELQKKMDKMNQSKMAQAKEMAKMGYKGTKAYVSSNVKAGESKSPWFYNGGEVEGEGITKGKDYIDIDMGDGRDSVRIHKDESMESRMNKYIESNRKEYSAVMDFFGTVGKSAREEVAAQEAALASYDKYQQLHDAAKQTFLKDSQDNDIGIEERHFNQSKEALQKKLEQDKLVAKAFDWRVKNVDEYKDYLSNIEPGALGTRKELQAQGVYGKDASFLRKAAGFATEAFNGSPLYARVTDKQIDKHVKDGTYKNRQDAVKALQGGKMKGKFGRAAAVVGDTVGIGGGFVAAGAVGMHALGAPFRALGNNDQQIEANSSVTVEQ